MTPEFRPHELEWTPEKVARIWDYYGSSPAYATQYFSAHSGGAIVERVEQEVGLRTKRVLDFGSGRGDLLGHLFARGIPAVGLEFSEESAALATSRFQGEPLFRGVTVAPGLPSPLPEGSFDVVFLVEVVEHLLDDQLEPTLAEVRRLLAPGGRVVATTPNEEDPAASTVQCPDCGATFHRWQHQRSFSAATLAELFGRHGFRTRLVEALDWGAGRRARLRARLRGAPAFRPHLLYVGATSAGER